jgi:hypothetical protein
LVNFFLIRGFPVPAWEAAAYLSDQGASAAGTPGLISGNGEGTSAALTQAIPGLLSIKEGLTAEGAAYRNQVFPDEGKYPS